MPNTNTQQLPNCKNLNGIWDRYFVALGFGISRFQMPNTNTQQLPNCKNVNGMWDQHFGVSGSRISRFQMLNTNTQQLPNCENVNGMSDQHFEVLGFDISRFQMPNTNTHQLGIILPPHICYLSILPRSFSLPWGFSQLSKSLIFRGYQWPNHWFSTCNNQRRGSSNMFPTHGVMVN